MTWLSFLAHLSRKCSWWAIVISLCPSSVRCQLFALNDFSSKRLDGFWNNLTQRFIWWPSTKNCSNRSAPLNNMAARDKNRKTFKQLLLLNQKMDFEIIIQEFSWVTLYQNCSNDSATWNNMAARAINRNKLLTTSSAKSVDRFWNNFTGMFCRWLSTKSARTVLLRWTRWPPELKIEKSLNDFSSLTSASILK